MGTMTPVFQLGCVYSAPFHTRNHPKEITIALTREALLMAKHMHYGFISPSLLRRTSDKGSEARDQTRISSLCPVL